MKPTPASTPNQALIFDYVGVLGHPQTEKHYAILAAIADQPVDAFIDRYWAHRHDYDLGQSDHDYWTRVLGTAPTPTTLQALVNADRASLTTLNPRTVAQARAASAQGIPIVVLSNAPTFLARAIEELPGLDFVDHFVFSCDISSAKPHEQAFTAAITATGLQVHQCTFIDDRRENIEAAAVLGLTAIHLTGEATLDLEPLLAPRGNG